MALDEEIDQELLGERKLFPADEAIDIVDAEIVKGPAAAKTPRKIRRTAILLAGVIAGCAAAYSLIVATTIGLQNKGALIGEIRFLRAGQEGMKWRIDNLKSRIDAVEKKDAVMGAEISALQKNGPPNGGAKKRIKAAPSASSPLPIKKEARRRTIKPHHRVKKEKTKFVYAKIPITRRIDNIGGGKGQVFLFNNSALFVAPDKKQVLLHAGEKMPNNARIVSVNPATGKIVTSKGAIDAARFNQIMSRYGY